MKKIGEKIKPLNEYENSVIGFDDFLGSSTCKYLDQFFVRDLENKYRDVRGYDMSYDEFKYFCR